MKTTDYRSETVDSIIVKMVDAEGNEVLFNVESVVSTPIGKLPSGFVRYRTEIVISNHFNAKARGNVMSTDRLTAPRVTPATIAAAVVGEYYFTAAEGAIGAGLVANAGKKGEVAYHAELRLLTICVLVLKNGFTVTGESACASPENFNAELGRKIARKNAADKIWPLEGYLLKQRLSEGAKLATVK